MAAPLRSVFSSRIILSRVLLSDLHNVSYRCVSVPVAWPQTCVRHTAPTSSQRPGTSTVSSQARHMSFFRSMSATDLWSGVVGVSNAGKKRGRGKRVGRKKVTDLNKGQMLGTGKANIVWPGLNAPVLKGREVLQRRDLPPNPERESDLAKLRDQMGRIRYTRVSPLLRGYSGSRFPGQSVGPPDPINDYTFDGFDSRVLSFKLVTNMTGTLGRKQRFAAFVIVGNKQGLAGYGYGKAQLGRSAIRVAKNRAAQNLQHFELFDGHTVFHNMYSEFFKSKMFIHKKEKGYGLKCHRVLKSVCEMIGITDLHVKCEGSTKNAQTVVRAFLEALRKQETHQELADRMSLHVVEFRKERDNFPAVVASPSGALVRQEPLVDEVQDLEMAYDRLYYHGKVEYKPKRRLRIYENQNSWKRKTTVLHKRRNQYDSQVQRLAGLW